jgi:hypothetical protein
LKQCRFAQPAKAPRACLTLIPIRWLNPSLETNDELANSAVFARIVRALAIVLLEPKIYLIMGSYVKVHPLSFRDCIFCGEYRHKLTAISLNEKSLKRKRTS